jgi:hypothetical protein
VDVTYGHYISIYRAVVCVWTSAEIRLSATCGQPELFRLSRCVPETFHDSVRTVIGVFHFIQVAPHGPRCDSDILRKIIHGDLQILIDRQGIGIENGPSHTEIKVTKEGPKIVELGARLGGDNITTHLVPLSTGVNMVEACINIALGEKPDITIKWNKGSAIRYFHQKKGVIKRIDGVDEAKSIPGIVQVSIVHNVGEQISEINNSGSRIPALSFWLSTKITFAPQWIAAAAVAVYVYAGTITSSPSPIPQIRKLSSSAAVAELRHTTLLVWQNSANRFSNCFVLGPVVIQPDLKVSTTSLISSSEMSGGLKGIFLLFISAILSALAI